MDMEDIQRGWGVFTEDGKRVGDVVEVHPHYLLVSRGLLVVRDVYVPRYAVVAAADHKVQLAITEERLRHMGWTAPPPPPPPPVDSPAPRLVPRYGADGDEDAPAWAPSDEDASAWAPPQEGAAPDYGDYYNADSLTLDVDTTLVYDDYEDLGIMFGASVEVDGEVYLATRKLDVPDRTDAVPIVLIHGWGFDRRVWDYFTLDLPRDYAVITYDARGYGGSTAPWTGYGVHQASRDLRVLLRTLDLQAATLVALDVGAAVALHYVLSGGRRAGRLILIAPSVVASGEEATAELPWSPHAWHDDLRRDRPRLATQLAGIWAPAASAETQAWLRDGILAAANHALVYGLDALAGSNIGYSLEEINLPTTVLHGREDPVVPLARGQEVAAAIPGARLVVLDAPGHLPMIADPERLVAEIRVAMEWGKGPAPVDDDTSASGAGEMSSLEAEGAPLPEPGATIPSETPTE